MRVRETIPDSVLSAADEMVLVDVTPEALIERLRAGKVYPPERIQAALNNFFKIENLAALREMALRQVAEEVELERRVRGSQVARREDRLLARAAPQAIGERLLALITPTPRSQRVVRRAWRSAQRLGAELDLLVVRSPGADRERGGARAAGGAAPPGVGARRAPAGRGGRRRRGRSRSGVARERGTTYLLMGTPKPRNAWHRLTQPALPFRLLRGLPGVDLRIVADRTLRSAGEVEVDAEPEEEEVRL